MLNEKVIFIAIVLGFVAGFVGWYAVFRLAGPLAMLLTSEWSNELRVSRVLTLLFAGLFLVILMFSFLWLLLLMIGPAGETSIAARSAIVLASFIGLACFGLVPKIEARIRRVAQFKDRRDAD